MLSIFAKPNKYLFWLSTLLLMKKFLCKKLVSNFSVTQQCIVFIENILLLQMEVPSLSEIMYNAPPNEHNQTLEIII